MTHPLRRHLLNVAAALRTPAMAARVMGRWGQPGSTPTAHIGAPATIAQLRHLRDTIGAPLPDGLQEVLQEVSADIDLQWVMRGHYRTASWGGQEVVTDVTPPDPFMMWSHAPAADGSRSPNAVKKPLFISGGLRFGLSEIEQAVLGQPGWQSVYADNPQDDAETRAHFDIIRDFMGAGLPVMTAGNGDWLAIDQRDESGCMLHVSHEGEEAGMEIDLTLPNFIAHQSWLGPITPDFSEIFAFSDSITQVVPGDHRVQDVSFDAQSRSGRIWRNWFWADSDLVPPDPGLLTRCGG